ncbi:MAG: DNA polymerase, partial [Betaproteobacteria bacterium]|nr:DNA polymerase [Betaproteobacteria bacterium]
MTLEEGTVNTLHIDIETYSSVGIRKGGLYRYAQAPDFQVLLLAWALDNGPVHLVEVGQGELLCREFGDAFMDPSATKSAHNAAFEWYCLSQHFKRALPIEQWHCTMVHALYCGYPAGLAAVGEALGLPQDKKKMWQGSSLIRTFCVPQKPTKANGGRTRTLPHHEPEKWNLFRGYCSQDVVTEREVSRHLAPWPVPEREQRLWQLDMRMNAYGVRVDKELVAGALYCGATTTAALMQEAVALSGIDNPKSVSQLKAWLEEETGEEIDDLSKGTVSGMLARGYEHNVQRMLEIRQELGKTSVTKYAAMQSALCDDGRVRGLLQFYGANRTGRWAGRLVQVQNLPRNYLSTLGHAREQVRAGKLDNLRMCYGNVPDTLSQLIRTAFIPAEGHTFVVADFSSIEARVIAWLAREQWRLDVFATHGKIYEASASAMFGVPIEKIKKGEPEYELRQKGKIAELALGYGGSTGALTAMGALKMGLTEEELPDIVQRWRGANPSI